jgi:hypothetical protein
VSANHISKTVAFLIHLEADGGDILVYRSGFDVATEPITSIEAHAFRLLHAGTPLGEVIVEFARIDAAPDEVASLFARGSSLKLILDSSQPGR